MKRNRYNTESEILRAIDAAKQRIVDALAEAESLEDSSRTLFRSGDAALAEAAAMKKEQADKLRRSATRITHKTLPKLGHKLSEFRTDLLPEMGTDRRTQFIDEGARIPLSGGWFTYRILNHLPVFMHALTDNFIELDENVKDIDSKEDYERVCKLYQP